MEKSKYKRAQNYRGMWRKNEDGGYSNTVGDRVFINANNEMIFIKIGKYRKTTKVFKNKKDAQRYIRKWVRDSNRCKMWYEKVRL